MALADITIADGQGTPVNHTFSYVGTVNGNRVVRSELTANPEQPISLTMAHSESKRGGVTTKSHMARFDVTILDTDGSAHVANIRVMSDIPNPINSAALQANLLAYGKNFLSHALADDWLMGSVG